MLKTHSNHVPNLLITLQYLALSPSLFTKPPSVVSILTTIMTRKTAKLMKIYTKKSKLLKISNFKKCPKTQKMQKKTKLPFLSPTLFKIFTKNISKNANLHIFSYSFMNLPSFSRFVLSRLLL